MRDRVLAGGGAGGYNHVMATTVEKVMLEALELSPELRAYVAEKLIESLDVPGDVPLSAAWKAEIRRRCAEIDSGAALLKDAEAVFSNAHASIT